MIIAPAFTRPARVLTAVALSAALLTGCAGGGGDEPVAQAPTVTQAPPTKAPDGDRLARVEDHSFQNQLKVLNPTDVKVERVQTPAGEVLRASFTTVLNNAQGKITTKGVRYILIRENSLFVTTISQVEPNVSARTAERIGRSFHPL